MNRSQRPDVKGAIERALRRLNLLDAGVTKFADLDATVMNEFRPYLTAEPSSLQSIVSGEARHG